MENESITIKRMLFQSQKKKQNKTNIGEDVGEKEPLYTSGGNVN
jgi:hypothetical protein